MNYLVHQGYPSSAVSFAREANLALSKESIDSITARMKIRNKIHTGDIESAIHDINTLNPQVLLPLCLFGNDYTLKHNSVNRDEYSFSLQNEPARFCFQFFVSWTVAYCSYSIVIPLYIFHYYDSNSSNSSVQHQHKEHQSSPLYHLQPNN
jgi:hypothetical protein